MGGFWNGGAVGHPSQEGEIFIMGRLFWARISRKHFAKIEQSWPAMNAANPSPPLISTYLCLPPTTSLIP